MSIERPQFQLPNIPIISDLVNSANSLITPQFNAAANAMSSAPGNIATSLMNQANVNALLQTAIRTPQDVISRIVSAISALARGLTGGMIGGMTGAMIGQSNI